MGEYVVEMEHITKQFGGFKANDDVTLRLLKGEIHALLGENGAGKSTLMSVLFGMYKAEAGTIKLDGKEVRIQNPNDANALGIGMVHQHFKLVHNFSVLQNIVLGHEDSQFGFLQMKEARRRVMELSEKYQLSIDPDALISEITVGMQQKVEILKMLYCNNRILIFDEPTAVLTPQEIDELMKIMKQLAKEGKSLLFITHKLDEIKAVADRCTVLRKGKYAGTTGVSDVSKEELSEMMVGRKVNLTLEKKEAVCREGGLKVENMTIQKRKGVKPSMNHVSFEVKNGEIVCIAGIDGNGQSELIYGLSGLMALAEGRILLNGEDITHNKIRQRCLKGLAHIPEDRHRFGMLLDSSLEDNLILQTYYSERFQKRGFLNRDAIRDFSHKLMEDYDIKCSADVYSIARGMSGGNQQKAVIARELSRDPACILAVQPVRGLDVGAVEYIHRQLLAQRDAGKAVLLVSFELDEVMTMSDRILVMFEGSIVADVCPGDITVQELGLMMAGGKKRA